MKIDSSTIQMASSHTYKQIQYTKFESVIEAKTNELAVSPAKPRDSQWSVRTISSIKELKQSILEQMMDILKRRKKEFYGQMYDKDSGFCLTGGDTNPQMPVVQTSGIYYQKTLESSFFIEEEHTAFVSNGKVTTTDGREIDFEISFEMSRRFEQQFERYSERTYELCDPLVFNFDGNVAELTDQKFYFDLDCDGEEEEISNLAKGSGFLALDLNNDGKINDGSELFGTKSGNGFEDLAKYDLDGNGWIDENDDIFDKLKIWTKNVSGEDELISIKEAGIGAINLGNVSTKFDQKDAANNMLGMIQRTGMFLYENGGAGTLQHVDFAV